jgi:short-subunit dehydrogenase
MGAEGFRDHAVIITGASSGIGEALACHLAKAGAFLALAARSAERLETVAAECRRLGAKAVSVPTDVSDEGQCKALIASTLTTFGRIDALINNAGFGVRAPLADLPSLALFVDVLNTNFMGSVYCTYYALPHLKQTRGRIVAVSSLAAKVPLPYYSSYTASKYAMAGFFDVIRMELEDSAVSVTTVYPDFVGHSLRRERAQCRRTPSGPGRGETLQRENNDCSEVRAAHCRGCGGPAARGYTFNARETRAVD